MPRNRHFIVYRVFYEDVLVYVGRTTQTLQNRMRSHLFRKPMHRTLFIDMITSIDYAELPSEADMNLYELYYINLWKPPLNVDDKAKDDLTVSLPELEWKPFTTKLWSKWQKEISENDKKFNMQQQEKTAFEAVKQIMRKKHICHEITDEEYEEFLEQNTPESKALMWNLYLEDQKNEND